MNNPRITKIYGLYNQDESGYNSGKAIAFYPIKTNKDSLIEILNDGKQHIIYAYWTICDPDDNYYLLNSPELITVEKLVMSCGLAVKPTISKLSDEEKKLLGL